MRKRRLAPAVLILLLGDLTGGYAVIRCDKPCIEVFTGVVAQVKHQTGCPLLQQVVHGSFKLAGGACGKGVDAQIAAGAGGQLAC